ncbi:MAG: hypothetical protein HKP30_13270 [Myxococcales bacterium]|nr:hypothetical protein [Myxococcales bacterium]
MQIKNYVRLGFVILFGAGSSACGSIDIPLDLALVGDNSITITAPDTPPLGTTLVGGVETTISVDIGLFSLLNPNGIVAGIAVDDLLIAGENIPILGGIVNTGTLCIEQNLENPGGGFALLKIFQSEADFSLALNTTIRGTDPGFIALLELSGIDSLPFDTAVETTVPLTLVDLLGLVLGGGGGGGLELSQDISTTLPADIPFFGGAMVDASLTLATVDSIPADPLLADCVLP